MKQTMRSMLPPEDIEAIKAVFAAEPRGGRTRARLADVLGLNPSAITDLLKGQRKLQKTEIEPLQSYLGIVLPSLHRLMSLDDLRPAQVADTMLSATVRNAHVLGETAAGVWLEHESMNQDAIGVIPYVPTRYSHMEQFAYKVSGPSMEDERIFDGDYVVCVAYDLARGYPQIGDVIVAERRRGGLLERSCKQISRDPKGAFCLISRSSLQQFAQPIVLAVEGEDSEVEIVGLVIGTFRPRW